MKKAFRTVKVLAVAALGVAFGLSSCKKDDPIVPVDQVYDGQNLVDIKSAVYDVVDTDLYTFYLSPRAGVTSLADMTKTNDFVKVTVRNPKGAVNTATEEYAISYGSINVTQKTPAADIKSVDLSAKLNASTLDIEVNLDLTSGKNLHVNYNKSCTEATLSAIKNQYELDKVANSLGSVVEWHNLLEGTTTYYFYEKEGVTVPSEGTPEAIKLVVTDDVDIASIDFAKADASKVTFVCGAFSNVSGTTGVLSLVKTLNGTTIKANLDGRNSHRLRIDYDGPLAIGYESTNTLSLTSGADKLDVNLTNGFGTLADDKLTYAFGTNTDAKVATDLMNGLFGLQLGLTVANSNKTIDLATEADKCDLKVFDYTNYQTYDLSQIPNVTGKVITAINGDNYYVYVNASVNGLSVVCDYYGPISGSNEAFNITPGANSANKVIFTEGDAKSEKDLAKVFSCKSDTYTNIAAGVADAPAAAADLMTGHYAFQIGLFGLSETSSTIDLDLAKDASKLTLKVYDYETYTAYDIADIAGVTGTVKAVGTDSKLYIKVVANIPGAPSVDFEWYGDLTKESDVFDLTPIPPFTPYVTIINPKEVTLLDLKFSSMELRKQNSLSTAGQAFGDSYVFYFRPSGLSNDIEEYAAIPQLIISATAVNAGDIDMSKTVNPFWRLRYGANGKLYSSGGYCNAPYNTVPTVGTINVKHNADNTWEVKIEFVDSFMNWGLPSGTGNTFTLEWKGKATKYTGTSTNVLTDVDY